MSDSQAKRWTDSGKRKRAVKGISGEIMQGLVPRYMSYHLSIGLNGDVWQVQQHARLDRITWNSGDRAVNSKSISIELPAHPSADPHGAFELEVIDCLVELVASLATITATLSVAVAHHAIIPKRRRDPGKRFPWSELRALGLTTAATPEEWASYRSSL